jgi:hypothetical protein
MRCSAPSQQRAACLVALSCHDMQPRLCVVLVPADSLGQARRPGSACRARQHRPTAGAAAACGRCSHLLPAAGTAAAALAAKRGRPAAGPGAQTPSRAGQLPTAAVPAPSGSADALVVTPSTRASWGPRSLSTRKAARSSPIPCRSKSSTAGALTIVATARPRSLATASPSLRPAPDSERRWDRTACKGIPMNFNVCLRCKARSLRLLRDVCECASCLSDAAESLFQYLFDVNL